MAKVKPLWIITGFIAGVAVWGVVIGGHRATALLRCQFWHFMNETPVAAYGLLIDLPSTWCPIDEDDEGLTLIMAPPRGEKNYLAARVRPLSGPLEDPFNPASEIFIEGEKLRLLHAPITSVFGSLDAVRLEYEREGDSSSTMIVWIFPDIGTMFISFRAPIEQGHYLDELVSGVSASGGI